MAHALRERGVGPDQVVGLCVARSLDLVIGALGILKAGGAYLPLDPEYPTDRLAMMLEDSGAKVLVVHEETRGVLAHQGETVAVGATTSAPTERLGANASPADLA